jgi:antitoxin YefM
VSITATSARKDFFKLLEQVNVDHSEIEITSKSGSAYLVSAHEYNALLETAHLLRSPANATRLAEAADDVREGRVTVRDLVDPDAA